MVTNNSMELRELLREVQEAEQRCRDFESLALERAQACERTIAKYGVNSTSARNDAGRATKAFADAEQAIQQAKELRIAYYEALYGPKREFIGARRAHYAGLAKP